MIKYLYFIIFYISFMWIIPFSILCLNPFSKITFNINLNIRIILKFLDIRQEYLKKNKLIKEGFVLSNHRSWLDFALDNITMDSAALGRYLAFTMMGFLTVLMMIDNRAVMFKRGRVNREYIYDLCKKNMEKEGYYNKRTLIYPEGTRMTYNMLNSKDDIKNKFKIGLLKEIYERNEYPVQILISSNKDKVFSEKKIRINRGITIKSAISQGIHPKDYNSFEEFLDKISEEWFELWKLTHL